MATTTEPGASQALEASQEPPGPIRRRQEPPEGAEGVLGAPGGSGARRERFLPLAAAVATWVAVTALSVGAARAGSDFTAWAAGAVAALVAGGLALGMIGRFLAPSASAWENAEAALADAAAAGVVPVAAWFAFGGTGLGLAIDLTLVAGVAGIMVAASAAGAFRTARGRHQR